MCHAVLTMACSTATTAFIGPRRAVMRRNRAPKNVVLVDRAATNAATPTAALRCLLPGRILVDLIFPADSLAPGDRPAQETSSAAVGNMLISAPVSAMNTSATFVAQPGML